VTGSAIMLNRAHYPVTTLGPGTRAGIWTQGCTIGCRGCASRDTWAADPAALIEVDQLVGWLATLTGLQGLTITGGEPFQQPVALAALLRAVRAWARERPEPIDILAYSGYAYGALTRRADASDALSLCDAVITGPYIDRLNPGGAWRGSANQRLVVLSDLGHERFDRAAADGPEPTRRLQMSSDGSQLWLIGIPGRGDLDRLERELGERGISVGGTSWRD
jgi:anaerobic ribonucleoside-triphosphate reductase activating protein